MISIHAPLAGCDPPGFPGQAVGEISIHAPLAGCDGSLPFPLPSAPDFNPRTPCGVRLRRATTFTSTQEFQSTHPLRGATGFYNRVPAPRRFQSTHPLRGATRNTSAQAVNFAFQSTHPLRGATQATTPAIGRSTDFNPRTPCGVRLSEHHLSSFSQ